MSKFDDQQIDLYLWGQVSVLVVNDLATPGEIRDSLCRLLESEEAWRLIPHALRNMLHAMPAIHAQTQLDDAFGKKPPGGGCS